MLMHPKMILVFLWEIKDTALHHRNFFHFVYFVTRNPTPWNQFSLALILSGIILIWHLRQTLQNTAIEMHFCKYNSVLMADSFFSYCVFILWCFVLRLATLTNMQRWIGR